MLTRRHALTLSAVLAATVLTGGAAVAGLTHSPAQATHAAALVQPAPPAPAQPWEGNDS